MGLFPAHQPNAEEAVASAGTAPENGRATSVLTTDSVETEIITERQNVTGEEAVAARDDHASRSNDVESQPAKNGEDDDLEPESRSQGAEGTDADNVDDDEEDIVFEPAKPKANRKNGRKMAESSTDGEFDPNEKAGSSARRKPTRKNGPRRRGLPVYDETESNKSDGQYASRSGPQETRKDHPMAKVLEEQPNLVDPEDTAEFSGDFPLVVALDGKWHELECRLCHANAPRTGTGFYQGVTSLKGHIKRAHAEEDTDIETIKRCMVRTFDQADLEKLLVGKEPLSGPINRRPAKKAA